MAEVAAVSVTLYLNAAISGEGQKYGCVVIPGNINVWLIN